MQGFNGNLGTTVQQIVDDLHSLISTTVIKRKLIEAIRFHRQNRLWFSERTFSFRMTEGKDEYAPGDGYGLPGDLTEIVGEYLYVIESVAAGVSNAYRLPVQRIDSETMERRRSSDIGRSEPEIWDFYQNRLRLYPKPDDDSDILEGRYVVDIGIPRALYESGSWAFYLPDGSDTLSDDYTSDWFDMNGGEPMIRHYAEYLLYQDVLHDQARAQARLQQWAEFKNVIEDETDAKTGPDRLVPTLLGEW